MEMNLGLQEVAQRDATIPWDKDGVSEVTDLSDKDMKEVSGGTGIIMTD